eukprot:jgi/Mesen1/9370/ME000610S08680
MEPEKLRSVIRDSLAKHLHSSAIFFADKLVTLSEHTPDDIYLLAQSYYLGQHYKRALHLLRQENLLTAGQRFQYLAAKCLEAVKEWDECLLILGDDVQSEVPGDAEVASVTSIAQAGGDCKEIDAIEQLIDKYMLTPDEEEELLDSLGWDSADSWLQQLYRCHANKCGKEERVEEKLDALEGKGEAATALWGPGAGVSLVGNGHVQACRAELQFQHQEFQRSYDATKSLLERDPYDEKALAVHIASALELGRKNELFLRAHQLVQDYPHRAVAWFAVGCYYMCVKQFDNARRHFCKATQLGEAYAPAWLGFGHAYAAQEESDQAMAAYRTATRLFPGCHVAVLCCGMESARGNNTNLALHFLEEARRLCPRDPLVHNELGALALRSYEFRLAQRHFEVALELTPKPHGDAAEAFLVNLAHAHRKQRHFEEAVEAYEQALGLKPREASTYAALGFTHHLQGNLDLAIDLYHKALSLRPHDSMAAEMLSQALADQCMEFANNGAVGELHQTMDY